MSKEKNAKIVKKVFRRFFIRVEIWIEFFYYHYPVRLRFATARHPFASEGDYCAINK
ncbi:MAG: hypothetical protein LBB23_02330 [Rickettsiales bacterium]|nr:hypothetical protein [Rickettsiales bacterium]